MEFSKDFSKRLDDIIRGIELISERLDTLSTEGERQYNQYRQQIKEFSSSSQTIKDQCERLRSDVLRLSRDVSNIPLTGSQQRSGQNQQSQMFQPGNVSLDQLAWTIAQAVSQSVGQSVANAVRQTLSGQGSPYLSAAPNASSMPPPHQA